jgi:hypothetical protein
MARAPARAKQSRESPWRPDPLGALFMLSEPNGRVPRSLTSYSSYRIPSICLLANERCECCSMALARGQAATPRCTGHGGRNDVRIALYLLL